VITRQETRPDRRGNQGHVSSLDKLKHNHPSELLSQKHNPADVLCVKRIDIVQHAARECLRADLKRLKFFDSRR
jgi:hypothetical protein